MNFQSKTTSEVQEFARRKAIIEKVQWNRDRIIIPSKHDKEEFDTLCSICCDRSDSGEWSRFEELALRYINHMGEPNRNVSFTTARGLLSLAVSLHI